MITETQTPQTPEPSAALFAARLQATREALRFDRKDVAAQLRLNEKVIKMMETNDYPTDLPPTFIRGYLRTYAKLLNIPESETLQHIEAIQPKSIVTVTPANESASSIVSLPQQNYFMHIFTSVIVLTLIALVGTWWHTHSASSSSNMMAANNISSQIIPITNDNTTEAPQQIATTEPPATASMPAPTTNNISAPTPAAPTATAAPTPSNTKAPTNQNDMDSDDEDDADSDTDNDAAD